MTGAERAFIERALGPVVLRAADRATVRQDPAAFRALALAVTLAATDLIIADRRAASMVAALWTRGAPVRCDAFATNSGLSFAEAWTAVAKHLARTGRAHQVEALLQSGVTVRQLLRQYGVEGEREWNPDAERRAFLRTLRRALN
jgi:hypothetical protein